MADVWNKITREYVRSVDRSAYGDDWVVIGKGAYPIDALPGCDPSQWEFVDGEIVEGESLPVVESMADRHAREQREGVPLTNGWVMKWTERDQLQMNLAKGRADLLRDAGITSPGVPFFEANGTPHLVGYAEAYVVLLDYSEKVLAEQQRQWQEASNG